MDRHLPIFYFPSLDRGCTQLASGLARNLATSTVDLKSTYRHNLLYVHARLCESPAASSCYPAPSQPASQLNGALTLILAMSHLNQIRATTLEHSLSVGDLVPHAVNGQKSVVGSIPYVVLGANGLTRCFITSVEALGGVPRNG